MKITSILLSYLVVAAVGAIVVAEAFQSSSSFIGRSSFGVSTSRRAGTMTMDLEQADVTYATARLNLDQLIREATARPRLTLEEAQAQHGMPWKESIDPKYGDEELLYMPFWDWQMKFIKENLTNVKVVSCSNGKTDFGYKENAQKKARIVSLCLSSAEYRKIRLTYYDAGDNTQVFNAVFYPDTKYNLPVLGVDVLAFNRKKYLAIVDFQPLHDNGEDGHASTYEHLLRPIKEQYDSLKGRMSSKFYDETKFFSQQMLFARFEDEAVIEKELFPAFTQYAETHLKLIRDAVPDYQNSDFVLERQRAYDVYSAERDPATGLFAAMFGADWARDFVHDFLFSLSTTEGQASASSSSTSTALTPPMMFAGVGGGPSSLQHQRIPSPLAAAPLALPTISSQKTFVQRQR